jgi:hypothetical protein
MEPEQAQVVDLAGGMLFPLWCDTIGISRRTGMRWRDAGKVEVVTINGMQFITAEAIRRFFLQRGGLRLRGAALRSRQERERALQPLSRA